MKDTLVFEKVICLFLALNLRSTAAQSMQDMRFQCYFCELLKIMKNEN